MSLIRLEFFDYHQNNTIHNTTKTVAFMLCISYTMFSFCERGPQTGSYYQLGRSKLA